MILLWLVALLCCTISKAENFPSLLQANATLAVVIDKEYLAEEFDGVRETVETFLVYAKREILKHGGVNVQYFSWTSINIRRDLTAVLSVASCADTWRLFNTAKEEHLLQIAISESDCPRLPPTEAITVPMLKAGEEMPQLVLDLRTTVAYTWKSAILIFDNTLERDMITRVVTSLTKISDAIPTNAAAVQLIGIDVDPSLSIKREKIKKTLQSINLKDEDNFLVIVSYDNMEVIMEIAKDLGMVNTKNQWLYVIQDTNVNRSDITGVKRLMKEGDNVSFLYNTTSGENCKSGIKCHLQEMLAAFTKALDVAIQDEVEIASLVSDEEWEAIRPTKMERRNFLLKNINNQLTQTGECGNCTTWKMQAGDTWGREYEKLKTDLIAELIFVGTWRPSDGISLVDELFPHIKHGFRGRTLPLATFHNPPWQIIKMNSTGHIIGYSGLIFDVIKELSNNLNFTFTVRLVQNTRLSATSMNLNGTQGDDDAIDIVTNIIPKEMVSMIQAKTIALGACGFTVTEDSKQFINFTIPVSTQPYTFVVSRPRELSRALLFMSPFRLNAWLSIAGALVLSGHLLYYIHILSPVYNYKGIDMTGGLSSVQNCIWYMYGALLQQGGMHLPHADSARIIVGAWWLVVLVISTTYCGNLVAFLTFPKIDIPITTVDELLAHRETVTWSIVKDSFLEQQLKITNEPKYKELYRGIDPHAQEPVKMLKQIEQGKHVYFDWKISLQYIMKKQFLVTDRCDLALGKDELSEEQISMVVAQNTPYLRIINEEIKRLHQVGLIHKWLSDYLPKRDRCFKVKHTEVSNHTVNLDDMQGSFFVLFLGFALGVLLIIFEKLLAMYFGRKDQKVISPYTT